MTKPGSDLRAMALDILMQYEKEGRKLRPLLLSVLEKNRGLERRDRAFVKTLTEGTVERLLALDWVIDQISNTKTKKMKPVIRMIIRMGAYQLLFMDHVPDSAAVDEAVKLARRKHIEGLSGFVNGVLRAVIRYRDGGIKYPNVRTELSCPAWIAERFEREYGRDKAEAMIRVGAGGRPLYLRVNRLVTGPDSLGTALKKEGIRPVKTELEYTLKVGGKYVPSESGSFIKGMCSVQDLSSQLAINELWKQIRVYINEAEEVDINIIDLCAAPGGKSCALAELLGDKAGGDGLAYHMKACDISEQKLARITENIKRTGVKNIEVLINDASAFNPAFKEKADIIIADLPCSGLGVLGRKVDIKYRVKPGDIDALCNLQRRMLDHAAGYLKKGGILLFSVCTVTKEETADQSEYIEGLGLHKVAERQLLQGVDPCDGFYYSLWIKD
ncbi:MAG: 16S rRNA (cytosine(967)-C(5))-methyltransferase RsmB [Lachnospiraceae bacterium]|nr:16S rRNA (cytosine(967)-C(5))-methyltransferase RsmB [Lachnospiraceae bacterium]